MGVKLGKRQYLLTNFIYQKYKIIYTIYIYIIIKKYLKTHCLQEQYYATV